MIPVKFVSLNPNEPATGYWDQHFLSKLFSRGEFTYFEDVFPEYAIVVFHADKHVEYVKEVNEYLSNFKGVLVIAAGDEHSLFPVEELKHPNMKLWVMTPHAGREYPNVDKFIGEMTTPHTSDLPMQAPDKNLKWFFAGQVTHKRRVECVNALKNREDGELIKTDGFAKGIDPKEYIEKMSRTKVVPCPGGPATPDTFRFYEALEAGCIPIVDEYSALNKNDGYWKLLFGDDFPVPTIKNWSELPGVLNYYYDVFPTYSNKVFAWWQRYKRNFLLSMIQDWCQLWGGEMNPVGITVIVPTSPIQSNPDTSIIEETIASIRTHLPSAEIIITFDGVRPEQEHLKDQYQEYVRRVLWKCNHEWTNIFPIVFDEHMHQVGMAREALKHVQTDKILYVEHDTPLTPDREIPWHTIGHIVSIGLADLVRFHFEAFIPKEHKRLILDEKPRQVVDVPAVRTIQWSQRPHVASVKFYKRILEDHFSKDAKTFIEDKMHSVVISAYKDQQLAGWNKFRLWIYHPEGDIKRSYHTDGRGKESKYSMTF